MATLQVYEVLPGLLAKPVIASAAKQSLVAAVAGHCERSCLWSLRAKRSNLLFSRETQVRPRLHAYTTSATADLRPAP